MAPESYLTVLAISLSFPAIVCAQATLAERLERVAVVSATPASGQPTYEESTEWLAKHTKLHCRVRFTADGTKDLTVTSTDEVTASRFPCVLMDVHDYDAARGSEERGISQVYLVSLPLVDASSLSVEAGQANPHPRLTLVSGSACVRLKGADGVVIKLEAKRGGGDIKEEPFASGSLCFDSHDNAQRAAKAIAHLVGLCSASPIKKEPF